LSPYPYVRCPCGSKGRRPAALSGEGTVYAATVCAGTDTRPARVVLLVDSVEDPAIRFLASCSTREPPAIGAAVVLADGTPGEPLPIVRPAQDR
jgi:hypothetical protein